MGLGPGWNSPAYTTMSSRSAWDVRFNVELMRRPIWADLAATPKSVPDCSARPFSETLYEHPKNVWEDGTDHRPNAPIKIRSFVETSRNPISKRDSPRCLLAVVDLLERMKNYPRRWLVLRSFLAHAATFRFHLLFPLRYLSKAWRRMEDLGAPALSHRNVSITCRFEKRQHGKRSLGLQDRRRVARRPHTDTVLRSVRDHRQSFPRHGRTVEHRLR